VLAAPKAAMHRFFQNQTHAAKNNKRRLKRHIKKTGHNFIFQWTVFFMLPLLLCFSTYNSLAAKNIF
jgi:hypothetical protein